MKKLLILCACLTISPSLKAQECPKPKETIFLWDMHDVFLTRDTKKIIQLIYSYPQKTNLLFSPLLLELLAFAWNTLFEEAYTEKLIQRAYRHNQPHFAQLVINVSNAQKPIAETVDIIKELHDQGYQHHLGSNISHSAYKHLVNKKLYPEFTHIFALFDLTKSHPVRYENNETMPRKPDPAYFLTYLEKHNIDPTHTRIIFIDDKLPNVQAAQSVGLTAIHFITPEKLRSDLQELGVQLNMKTHESFLRSTPT